MSNKNHEEFVTTKSGCAQIEIILMFYITAFTILLRNMAIPWIFLGRRYDNSFVAYWSKFLMEFVLIILSPLISCIIFPNHLGMLAVGYLMVIGLLMIFISFEFMEHNSSQPLMQTWNRIIDSSCKPTTYVTYLRATTMIFIITAILAVDFEIFPRKYAKTETFGHSLMDVGVAACVFISGMSSVVSRSKGYETRKQKPRSWYMSSTFILFCIGFTRTFVLWLISYQQKVTEYGLHWNFFFTLAFIQIFSKIIPKQYPLVTCLVIAICHQTLLKSGYQHWIIAENMRENLIAANAEGIFTLPGYLTMFYASMAVGEFLSTAKIRLSSWLRKGFDTGMLALIVLFCQWGCEYVLDPPSRRVVNVTYVLSQLFLMIASCSVLIFIQTFNIFAWCASVPQFSNGDHPFETVSPCVCDSINKHSLLYFLLANVLTGLVNLSIDTHEAGSFVGMTVLIVYLFIATVVPHALVYKNLKKIRSE